MTMKIKRGLFFAGLLTAAGAAAETRIGIIGLDGSHAIDFTRIINVEKHPDCDGFRVTSAYKWGSKDIFSSTNRYPAYIRQITAMGVEILPSIDELVGKVDCVMLLTNDGREHLWQAEKVFKSGKPCFIDKPIAHNLRDAVRILDLGKKTGAKFFSSSSLRYGKVVQAARNGEYGAIRTAVFTSPAPEEAQGTHGWYTWYGVHGFEPYVAVMGTGAEKVSCLRTATDDAVSVQYPDGRIGQLRFFRNKWAYTGLIVPEKPKDRKVPAVMAGGESDNVPLVADILRFFKTGKAPFPPEETLEIFVLMEAAEVSAKRGGAPVTLAEVMSAARGGD